MPWAPLNSALANCHATVIDDMHTVLTENGSEFNAEHRGSGMGNVDGRLVLP